MPKQPITHFHALITAAQYDFLLTFEHLEVEGNIERLLDILKILGEVKTDLYHPSTLQAVGMLTHLMEFFIDQQKEHLLSDKPLSVQMLTQKDVLELMAA